MNDENNEESSTVLVDMMLDDRHDSYDLCDDETPQDSLTTELVHALLFKQLL